MAMTKRVRVTFDSKFVAGTNDINEFAKKLVSYSKRFMEGDKTLKGEKVDNFKLGLLEAALNGGPDAAAAYCIRHGLRSMIKEAHDDLSFNEKKRISFSPVIVRVTE